MVSDGYSSGLSVIKDASISNSYNYGNQSATSTINTNGGAYVCGIVAWNGWITNPKTAGTITNTYCTTATTYSYRDFTSSNEGPYTKTGRVEASTLKEYASDLGLNNWVADQWNLNNGYPILKWQEPSEEEN